MSALDSAHTALALGCADAARRAHVLGRPARRAIAASRHHTRTVLDLLLAPVTVALPAGMRSPVGAELRAGLRRRVRRGGAATPRAGRRRSTSSGARPARIARHDWRRAGVDLAGYAASGLPAATMGRTHEDPLFFARRAGRGQRAR